MAALDYRTVRDIYDSLKDAGAVQKSMPEWARDYQLKNNSDLYSAGTRDGWWTRASNWADQHVFEPIADATTAPLGAAIGGLFGNEEAGRSFGRSVPRMLADTAPLFIPGVGELYGALGTGALIGAHTYADTGSGKAATIAGIGGAALPFIGRYAGGIGARLAGGELVDGFASDAATGAERVVNDYFPKTAEDAPGINVARYAGSQVGILGTNLATSVAQDKVLNPDQPLDFGRIAKDTLLTQIPFTVWDIKNAIHAPTVTASEARVGLTPKNEPVPQSAPIRTPSAESPESRATLDAIFEQNRKIAEDPNATPQQLAESFKQVVEFGLNPDKAQEIKQNTAGTVRANDEVEFQGRARKTSNGSYKVFVENPGGLDRIGVQPEHTVFVNGVEPTATDENGVSTFKARTEQVNRRGVNTPFTREDFVKVPDPSQPDLPEQAKPAEHPLAPDTSRALDELSAHIEATDLADAETHQKVTSLVDAHEAAAAKETAVKEDVAKPIETPEDAVKVLTEPPTSDWWKEEMVRRGLDPARTFNDVDLGNSSVREAIKSDPTLSPEQRDNVLKTGSLVKPVIESEVKSGATPIQATEKVRLQQATPEVDTAQLEQALAKEQVQDVAKTTALYKGKPQNQYGTPVQDENGKRLTFETRAEALAHQETNPDLAQHVIRDAGKTKKGEAAGFYLAPVLNKEISLDALHAEGTDLHNIVADEGPTIQELVDATHTARPIESVEALHRVLDVATAPENRNVFMNETGYDLPDMLRATSQVRFVTRFTADGPKDFNTIAAAMKGAKLTPFKTEREMLDVVQNVQRAASVIGRKPGFALGTEVPHDPELVKAIGIGDKPVSGILDYFNSHPDFKDTLQNQLVQGLTKAKSFDHINFTYEQRKGWEYNNGTINVPYLPSQETLPVWHDKFVHEITHDATQDLLTRTDPAAMRFKSTLQESMDAIKASPLIPKEVRKSFKEFPDWFEAHSQSDNSQGIWDNWHKTVGDKHDDWLDVVYGLQNMQEHVSGMFGSGKMVEVMQNTKMPRTVGQTVMQYLSKAWNAVFGGGKPEMDTAFAQVLQGFDNYLGGKVLRRTIDRVTPEIPAGPGLLYGISGYDPQTNTLGGKHRLPRDGNVTTDVLKNIGGVNKPLADGEIELYKTIVPEAFAGEKVNVPKLVNGLKEKGPVVETKELGTSNDTGSVSADVTRLTHELDTSVGPDWIDTAGSAEARRAAGWTNEQEELLRQYDQARLHEINATRAGTRQSDARYSFLGPKPESEMPGYVEGLVRTPTGEDSNWQNPRMPKPHEGVLYTGPHFGSEDTNVLAFYRGYEETLPDGTKAFHVIEVQSDWGQAKRNDEQRGTLPRTALPGHPLLRVYESLALKAAIQHAKEVGATKVILSDGETAMMTEGHDKVPRYIIDVKNKESGETMQLNVPGPLTEARGMAMIELSSQGHNPEEWQVTNFNAQLKQEAGMRLHYDQTLPSAMEKLTGQKGERVDVGTHKSVDSIVSENENPHIVEHPGNGKFYVGGKPELGSFDTFEEAQVAAQGAKEPIGSPVFRNPDGTPKSSITGRAYDISKVGDAQTLFDQSPRPPSLEIRRDVAYNARDYIKDHLIADGVRPEALASKIDSVEHLFTTGDLGASVDGFAREARENILPASANVERATAAALKYPDGTIHEGPTHGHAFDAADAAGAEGMPESGFNTNKGRFVNDREAADLNKVGNVALDSSQLDKGRVVDDNVRSALSGDKIDSVRDAVLGLVAGDVPAHQDLWNHLRQDVKVAMALHENIKNGYVPGTLPPNVAENMRVAATKVNAMRRALDKQAIAIDRMQDILAFHPEGFEGLQASQLTSKRLPGPPDPTGDQGTAYGVLGLRDEAPTFEDVRRDSSLATLQGKNTMGAITRALMLTSYTKQLYPAFRATADHVRLQIAKMSERAKTLRLAYSFNKDTGQFDPNVIKSNLRVQNNPSMSKAASNIMRYINVQQQGGKQWSFDDPEVKIELGKSGNPNAVKQAVVSQRSRQQVYTETVLPQILTEHNNIQTARVLTAHEVGMMPDVALDLSKQLYAGIAAVQDPAQAVVGNQMLQTVASKMKPETYIAAIRHAQGSIEDANRNLEFMRSRPDYANEQRFDAHHLIMRGPDGQEFRTSAKTKSELDKIRIDKEKAGYEYRDYIPKTETTGPTGITTDMFKHLQELDNARYARLSAALEGAPDDIRAAALSETQAAQQYKTATEAYKPMPNVSRRFIEGREYINMLQNSEQFFMRMNYYWRNTITRAGASLYATDPSLAGNRELASYAAQHVDNSLRPDNPVIRKITEAMYFQRLGFSLGNSLLESTQNLTTGMQQLIAETGSVGDAFTLWRGAVKQIGERVKTGDWQNPEIKAMLEKARHRGLIDMTSYSDVIGPDEQIYHVTAEGQNPLAKGYGVAQHAARKWSVFFQRYNDIIGLITGHELAKAKGMSGDDAFNFAWDLKDRGYFSGGKAQRSVGLWNIKTVAVPQMMNALQTYTLGWFGQMAAHYKIGFTGAGAFTPQQRVGARKGFVYGLAAQAVLAGALGMPGMGQGMALVKQATGFDLKGWTRAHLAKMFDEDQETGGWMTNIALRGSLAGVTPIDVSNRAAISFPFIGVDPYKGFDVAQLLGAPGSSVADAMKGMLALAHGDMQGFQAVLPSALKPAAQLIQGGGDIRDSRGGLLYPMSRGEQIASVIGLPSSRIQQARDAAEAIRNINTQATRQKESEIDDLATTFRKEGDSAGRLKLHQYLQANPDEDGRSVVQKIAGRVEAQTVPYDYRRGLNAAADVAGLGSSIKQPGSEVARRQSRYATEAALGLRVKPNLRADRLAATTDQVLNSDPYGVLSLGEARSHAEGILGVRRRNNELAIPGFQ